MTLSDEYCTPKWLADRLKTFGTDPCTNSRSHIKAIRKYRIETGRDGLKLPWFGRVWLNPPYSNPLPWMEKLHSELDKPGHATESLVLVKLDTSTRWWKCLTDPYEGPFDLWTFNKRLQFEPPPGVRTSSNNFCSALIHYHPGNPQLDLHDVAQLWHNVFG